MEEDQKPQGRPTDYTNALGMDICARLASGRTLRSVCRDDDMPVRSTVYLWIIANKGEVRQGEKVLVKGFSDHYNAARDVGIDEIVDETVEIADDSTNDFMEMELKTGKKKVLFDKEAVMRSRLRVDARQWYVQNMAPRKYGKNIKIESQALDKDGKPADQPGSAASADSFLEAVLSAIKKNDGVKA